MRFHMSVAEHEAAKDLELSVLRSDPMGMYARSASVAHREHPTTVA